MPRYQATKEGMMKGYWRIVDTETSQTVRSGLVSGKAAKEIAFDMSTREETMTMTVEDVEMTLVIDRRFKDLEFEQQAFVRRMMRQGRLVLDNGIVKEVANGNA